VPVYLHIVGPAESADPSFGPRGDPALSNAEQSSARLQPLQLQAFCSLGFTADSALLTRYNAATPTIMMIINSSMVSTNDMHFD
jgi:hypothetical protein